MPPDGGHQPREHAGHRPECKRLPQMDGLAKAQTRPHQFIQLCNPESLPKISALNTMGRQEIEAFLTHLAVDDRVAASTRNQALSALLFLYREVLHQELGPVDSVRARKPKRLPTVLTKSEALRVG